jgi:hypothetical protein
MTHHHPDGAQPRQQAGGTRRRRLLFALTATPVLVALVVGGVGLLHGAPAPEPAPRAVVTREPRVPTPRSTTDPGCPSDGIGRLAGLLFDWDTTTSSRQDVVRRIAERADPTGTETPGLLTDLDGYLPTEDAWPVLAGYRTRQALTDIRSRTPDSWPAITATDHAHLPTGVAAFTIDGSRHRAGTIGGARTVFTDRVSFTMIVTCPTDGGGWRLLRLSRLGEPLP